MSYDSSLDDAMEMMARYDAIKTETQYLDLQKNEMVLVQTAARIFGSYIAAGLVKPENKDQYLNTAVQDALSIACRIEEIVSEKEESPD